METKWRAAWICQLLKNPIGHGYIRLNKPVPVDLSQWQKRQYDYIQYYQIDITILEGVVETRGVSRCLFRLHNLIPQTYDIMWYIFDSGVFGDVVETPNTDNYFRPF